MTKHNGPDRAREALDALTGQLIDAMEQDPGGWTRPWSAAGLPANGTTGRRYHGTNVMLLSGRAVEHGWTSNRWGTYRQWQGAGCQVRKGERSSVVVFYKTLRVPAEPGDTRFRDDSADGAPTKRIPLLRYSSVFAAEQVDGDLAERLRAPGVGPDPDGRAEAFLAGTGAAIGYGGDEAFYRPSTDTVTLPPRHTFATSEGFYSTALHELTHWTGAAHRLDRTKGATFGDDQYAREELVAELGAVFAMAHLGLAHEPTANSAAYVAHWAGHLRQRPRDLWATVGQASDALELLVSLAEPDLAEHDDDGGQVMAA